MKERGFGILETLVVIFILALISSVFANMVGDSLKKTKQKAMAYSVKTAIEGVRVHSILKGEKLKIKFYENFLRVYRYEKNKWKIVKDIDFSGVRLKANNSPIFYPYGTVSNLFTLYVEKDGFIRKITMNINGKIYIK